MQQQQKKKKPKQVRVALHAVADLNLVVEPIDASRADPPPITFEKATLAQRASAWPIRWVPRT
jgi:hypothetical protein